jgi:hypothetical protein
MSSTTVNKLAALAATSVADTIVRNIADAEMSLINRDLPSISDRGIIS